MYEKEKEYVREYLKSHNGNDSRRDAETFRKRDKHMNNVYHWARRIVNKLDDEDKNKINYEALYLACLFHDIGYGSEAYKNSHAIEGSEIWKNYADDNKYDLELTNYVYYLIRNHSNKELLKNNDTPLELIILQEADYLDEEGAMSIIWDCMVIGQLRPDNYEAALKRIMKYSAHILKSNPLVTKPGREFWQHKQMLVKDFIEELKFDLFLKK